MTLSVFVWWILAVACFIGAPRAAVAALSSLSTGQQRNNWAVIVDTSRYWYNYRHVANTLSFYHTVKRLGIPDHQIILMLAEDIACNPRSPSPGSIFNDADHRLNLYGGENSHGVEVDFRGDEVTVTSFIRLLTGRQAPFVAQSRRLLTDADSNVFIFMTGHGGEEFLKFQDWEEITSQDFADAFEQMYRQQRYGKVLFVTDTCQAATLQTRFYSPGILAAGCSKLGENSYSHHIDRDVGIAVIDRFTYYSLRYLEGLQPWSTNTMQHFFDALDPADLQSTPEVRTDLFPQPLNATRVTDFLASTGTFTFESTPFPIQHHTAAKLPIAEWATESCSFYAAYYAYDQQSTGRLPGKCYYHQQQQQLGWQDRSTQRERGGGEGEGEVEGKRQGRTFDGAAGDWWLWVVSVAGILVGSGGMLVGQLVK
ncbi:unnamed protein product [Vitrella brassicaformis CCMP3155]|uniref:GPI-anchor transamidase n=2 Tax=Vitrella brassicaformis TaxID=1169539 RepID=A0A0G4ES38_VITBC|nr:unnamed protein product [Vitrella brassicaformis CCMP3155]|eukprot:CEM00675.1 unnamed protein product [Vitrella brassicaformis CCMP3155]